MSESMMVKGPDRIAANSAIPIASPIGDYTTPVSLSRAAPMVAEMPPSTMVTFSIPQNYVIILAAGCILLAGVLIGVYLLGGRKER